MGQRTSCNYCLVEDMRKYAARTEQVVTVKSVRHPSSLFNGVVIFCGVDIFIHPPGTPDDQLEARELGQEPPKYFAAWLAALPDHCCCGED